ncbi:MAG: PIN domain-containing protein [Spirochaetaceae bacterium]|nr:MAG: PIN domain-containing protein [Spirochaetaceae bacterium]
MPQSILVDTGPLIALFDRDDAFHAAVIEFISANRYRFISTTAVLTEVSHMLDFNTTVQIDFLEWVMNGGVMLHPIHQSDIARIVELTKTCHDRPMDFADATLLIAAERTGLRQIISIDSDFDIYRLSGNSAVENVFRPRFR